MSEPNMLDEAKLLYQSRLEVMRLACELLATVTVSPDQVLQLVDRIEARLMAPSLTRCWAVALDLKDAGGPKFFCGWGGPYPAWTDHVGRAVLFAREQDAAEFIHSIPLEYDEGRGDLRALCVGGPT